MRRYQCGTCRYIYDPGRGDPENDVSRGTPFDELPFDWMCPGCGGSMDVFEPKDENEDEALAGPESREGPEE